MTTIPWVKNPDGTNGDTWNPVVGCTSKKCPWCYARVLHNQRHAAGMKGYERPFSEPTPMPARLAQPLSWRKPRGVFVCSMGDIFDPTIPFEYIAAVFGVMAATPRHTFYLLTKQPERMEAWFGWADTLARPGWVCSQIQMVARCRHDLPIVPDPYIPWPLPNVLLGVSVTNQADASRRIPVLLRCPAAKRFVSCEPLLSGVDLSCYLGGHNDGERTIGRLDWVIMGGATGPLATPMHPDWARSARDQCQRAGVPFFFKSWGEWATHPDDDTPIVRGATFIEPDGRSYTAQEEEIVFIVDDDGTMPTPADCDLGWPMYRVGRAASGHLLDGVEHREIVR